MNFTCLYEGRVKVTDVDLTGVGLKDFMTDYFPRPSLADGATIATPPAAPAIASGSRWSRACLGAQTVT